MVIIDLSLLLYVMIIIISIIGIIISINILKENSKHYIAKSIQGALYIISSIIVIIFSLINILTG